MSLLAQSSHRFLGLHRLLFFSTFWAIDLFASVSTLILSTWPVHFKLFLANFFLKLSCPSLQPPLSVRPFCSSTRVVLPYSAICRSLWLPLSPSTPLFFSDCLRYVHSPPTVDSLSHKPKGAKQIKYVAKLVLALCKIYHEYVFCSHIIPFVLKGRKLEKYVLTCAKCMFAVGHVFDVM